MDTRRALPAVDTLLRRPELGLLLAEFSRDAVAGLVRQVLAAARDASALGATPPALEDLTARVLDSAARRWQAGPPAVINATGVVLHTNLGRAPLSRAAAAAGLAAATAYSALEFDLSSGRRGSRHDHLVGLLQDVTGAEDGLAVNNNAAGLLLCLTALCKGREVIVSRGQAVEIGGGVRIPAILRQSGARLVEVGTTNKTRLADYAEAISPRTAAILRVHSSNFRIVGFTEQVEAAPLAALAHHHSVPLIDDVGSGALRDVRAYGLRAEPMPQESIAAGADIVLFSGDKLLGGPQAGLIVGRAALLADLRRQPLMRVLRPDKVTIAALAATLLHYVRGDAVTEVPVWRMIAAPAAALEERAHTWLARLPARAGRQAGVEAVESTIGGGSLPGETLPSYALALRAERRAASWASATARALRLASPAVVARVESDRVLLDPRTVPPEQDDALLAALLDHWMTS